MMFLSRRGGREPRRGPERPPPARSDHAGHEGVAPALICRLALRWVAVDEGAQEHRVRVAAHLVLDAAQHLARVGLDDVLEAVLIRIALLGDEAPRIELVVRPREVR